MTDSEVQTTTPRWSLITVTYNSAKVLADHWHAERPKGVEWIVVDNASHDGSPEVAESLGATHVLRLEKNVGFGAANNLGFARATGEYVVFVNPDIAVDYASLPLIERALREKPGIVGPQLIYPSGELQPSGRGAPSLANKVLARLGVPGARRRYYLLAEAGEEREVAWLIGAAVAAPRAVFARLRPDGPWDPAFFVYYEDSDLGLRAWLGGESVRVLGEAKWVHSWARETSKLRVRPWLLELKAMQTFYRRYPALLVNSGGGRRFDAIKSRWGLSVRRATD